MLEVFLLEQEKIAVLRPSSPLEASDFENAARQLDPEIERLGGLHGLMVIADDFPGWDDFEAAVSHFRFVRDHHKKIARVALISDSGLLKNVPSLARLFVDAEVRSFALDDEDEARAWVAADGTAKSA